MRGPSIDRYISRRGPLGYVIFAEVSSAKLRSKTVGIGILVNSLCGMVMNIVIPYLYVLVLQLCSI